MYAKYTVVLKELMSNADTSTRLNAALSTYPLYSSKSAKAADIIPKREELNTRLLNAYKYREIGFETVGRFLDELQMTMCEIMPYYNELYKTVETMANLENPFDNVDFVETYQETRSGTDLTQSNATHEGTSSGESSSTSSGESSSTSTGSDSKTGTNKSTSSDSSQSTSTVAETGSNSSKKVHSDTPQNSIGIVAADINAVDYANDIEWNAANSNSSTNSTNSGTSSASTNSESSESSTNSASTNSTNSASSNDTSSASSNDKSSASAERQTSDTIEHTFTKKGNQGVNTYAHDMIEFRTAIIDVTNQIINDERISELFMRVF